MRGWGACTSTSISARAPARTLANPIARRAYSGTRVVLYPFPSYKRVLKRVPKWYVRKGESSHVIPCDVRGGMGHGWGTAHRLRRPSMPSCSPLSSRRRQRRQRSRPWRRRPENTGILLVSCLVPRKRCHHKGEGGSVREGFLLCSTRVNPSLYRRILSLAHSLRHR